jgi:hypothetical protein
VPFLNTVPYIGSSLAASSYSAGQEILCLLRETEGSSPFSQKSTTEPYPEPTQSIPHPYSSVYIDASCCGFD